MAGLSGEPTNSCDSHRGIPWMLCAISIATLFATLIVSAGPVRAQEDDSNGNAKQNAEESAAPPEAGEKTDAADADAAVITSDSGVVAEQPVDPHFEIPIPQRPYRTLVLVGFRGESIEGVATRRRLLTNVRNAIDRVWGPMLEATVRESDWLIPGSADRLRRVQLDDVLERYPEISWDKVLLVVFDEQHGQYVVGGREYDPRIQELTSIRSAVTLDARSLADIGARVLRDSFRPALFYEGSRSEGDELELLLQAGNIIPPDPAAQQIASGDILRTFMRYMERRDPLRLRSLQRLDLTYVRVTDFNRDLSQPVSGGDNPEIDTPISIEGKSELDVDFIDRSHVNGVLISHLPIAPFGQRGRNVQQMAVRQRPSADRSSVQLVLRTREDRPLVCYRVDRVAKLRWREDSELPSERLVSDRNGRIEIPVDSDHPTFWLYVYSGALLLARVPYAPGLIPEDTIRLPDDSIRLGVEGELYLFRDDLVDIVAKKAVIKSLAKKAAAAGKPDELDAAVQQLTDLPGKREFDAKLNAIRQTGYSRADASRNRSARRKVERLCDAMSESLELFFSSEKQVQQLQEIEKLKQTARARKLGGTVDP